MYYRVSLEGHQAISVRSFSFAIDQQAFESINQPVVYSSEDHPKRTSADNGTQKLVKTETYIFIITKQK